jgi:hypothetical protein
MRRTTNLLVVARRQAALLRAMRQPLAEVVSWQCTGCGHETDPDDMRAPALVCTGCTGERQRDKTTGRWL